MGQKMKKPMGKKTVGKGRKLSPGSMRMENVHDVMPHIGSKTMMASGATQSRQTRY